MLLQVDLSQAELRTMACLSGDTWMIQALQGGVGDYFDIHMMPICFPNIDITKIDAVKKKELRVQIKTVVYGLAFDRGAVAIAEELNITPRAAQTILDNYLSTAWEFAEWREHIRDAAMNPDLRDQYLLTPFGRRFQSEVVTRKNAKNIQREALAFMPQAISSDICLVTAIRIHPWIKEQGAHIVALVHDAILVEIPDYNTARNGYITTPSELADIIGQRIQLEFRETGKAVFGDTVPFLSEYSFARSWGDLQ